MTELAQLGFTAAWQDACAAADPAGAWQPVRVAAEHRGAYQALGPGGGGWIELPGKTFHTAEDKRALPTVGDWVLVERWSEALTGAGAAVVRAVLPRHGFLVRKAAGEATLPQPLAANVDVGLVLTSANADLSVARIDRYLSLLSDGGIAPVIAVSKVDLVADAQAIVDALRAIAPHVVPVSTVTGRGLDAVRALVPAGKTGVLLGSSGVGKSSLLNAIAGTAQPTRAIRHDARGRHTTTHRELFVGSDGALWIDTPGMRELGQWIESDDPDVVFADIAALAAQCKFRDCRHQQEPGCAVRDAVPAARLASYHKLLEERRSGTARQAQGQRLAESRRAKKPPPRSE